MNEKIIIKSLYLEKLEILFKIEFKLNNENEIKEINYYFNNEKLENEKLLKNLSNYLKENTNLSLKEITYFYYDIIKEI